LTFDGKIGVIVPGFGSFYHRQDSIGGLHFVNPLFVLSESFAHAYGLHDRRPKNVQLADTEVLDIDAAAIASFATELVGEVVGKELVMNAVQDIFERLGEVCADPHQYGIIVIDFGFARLTCENRSVEFTFGGASIGGTEGSATPATSKGIKHGSLAPLDATDTPSGRPCSNITVGGSGLHRGGRPCADAPLQRPHRPHIRPKYSIKQVIREDMLSSHAKQLGHRAGVLSRQKEEEMTLHVEMLQRLRSEMVLDFSQREQRKELMQLLASQQKVQQDEKRSRDQVSKAVVGQDYWPFRTEEQVQQALETAHRVQRSYLDQQILEKRERLGRLRNETERRQLPEQEHATEQLNSIDRDCGAGRPQGKGTGKPLHSVERALEDAFARYEDYLHTRKQGADKSASFEKEQRYLSGQAELLKAEESQRRLTEMRAYLDRQVRDKERAKASQKEAMGQEQSTATSALPVGSQIDEEEEAHVKMALKHALDGQVERKRAVIENEKAASLQAEQQALGHVAQEMQEARYRTYKERREQEHALRSTWAKQLQLRRMQATLEKAETV